MSTIFSTLLPFVIMNHACADRIASLIAKRKDCERYNHCKGATYPALLVELGDAWMEKGMVEGFLVTDSVDSAIEAYDAGSLDSYNNGGPESDLHSKALLRLADSYLSKGEYKVAYDTLSFHASWIKAHTKNARGKTKLLRKKTLLRILAKQGEAAALGSVNKKATAALDQAVELQQELMTVAGGLNSTQYAWLRMLSARALAPADETAALEHISRALDFFINGTKQVHQLERNDPH